MNLNTNDVDYFSPLRARTNIQIPRLLGESGVRRKSTSLTCYYCQPASHPKVIGPKNTDNFIKPLAYYKLQIPNKVEIEEETDLNWEQNGPTIYLTNDKVEYKQTGKYREQLNDSSDIPMILDFAMIQDYHSSMISVNIPCQSMKSVASVRSILKSPLSQGGRKQSPNNLYVHFHDQKNPNTPLPPRKRSIFSIKCVPHHEPREITNYRRHSLLKGQKMKGQNDD